MPVIQHEMSWAALAALSGDAALVVILRERGMPVIFNPDKQELIVAEYGKFGWHDLGVRTRVFRWEAEDYELPSHQKPVYEVKVEPTLVDNGEREVRFKD